MAGHDIEGAREWLRVAESDLGVAKHLFETYYPKPLEIICFHSQQAAEKAVKAIIVLYGCQGGLPRKHDLFILLNQIKNMVHIEDKFYDYADSLAPYSITMRYPHELFLEERHAKEAIRMADEMFSWAKAMIDEDTDADKEGE